MDLCNRYLEDGYGARLKNSCGLLEKCRNHLQNNGWQVEETDLLRITIKAPAGMSGNDLAEQLRKKQIECEFADEDYLVLMATPENSVQDFKRLIEALGENKGASESLEKSKKIPLAAGAKCAMTMRDAYFAEGETIPVHVAQGRICRMPTAACPPAIPVVVPGEIIDEAAVESFLYYGIETVEVVKWQK
jgi:arginine/lysine/ornithine decarboxylase